MARNNGATLLFMSSQKGHQEVMKLLLASGAKVDQVTKYGDTPLYKSSQEGRPEVVKLLLANGAKADHADNDGITSLYKSSQNGHREVVKLLLDNGATVDKPMNNNGNTPLLVSSMKGHGEVVKLLLAKGARVGQAASNGFTPLAISNLHGQSKIVQLLLAHITAFRRLAVLSSIRQVRLNPPTPPPSRLLSLLANTPDDIVRVILEFMGARLELCNKCDLEGKTIQKCSGCKQVLYCSRECQRRDWKAHKGACKKVAARKEEGGKGK